MLHLVPGAVVGGSCAGAKQKLPGLCREEQPPGAGSSDVLNIPGTESKPSGLLNLL